VPYVPVDSHEQRTLVLTAFPVEAEAVLSHTTLDPDPVVVADRRHFYLGSIRGTKVIVAMTGIGMVNATETTEIALNRFARAVGAVAFSGVAGGAGRIGLADVTVPVRWTLDNGTTFHPVDPAMFAVAEKLSVTLEPVKSTAHLPLLLVGGDGCTFDNNNGQAFPGIPNGGGVFGCQPRTVPDRSRFYTGNFFQAAWPWLRHGLISNVKVISAADPAFVATDNETAAAQVVADAHGIPFLGIRGISDGPGDPLRLPGFPFQFFVYNKVAAANAARVTTAFLQSWSGGYSGPRATG
jgi:nucleoside phosphorylase